MEEDPQAVDQVAHQAGAHQVEEEEACPVGRGFFPAIAPEQEEVEESLEGIPPGSLTGPAAKPTPL